MKIKNIVLSIATGMIAILATAAPRAPAVVTADPLPNRCKTPTWTPGDIITVQAQLMKQTHITLPEDALDVVWGTEELWEQNFIKNHVFLRPRTKEPEGAETTITVVGASGNTYEFRIERVDHLASHCVVVKAQNALINRANWETKETAQQAQITLLQQQLAKANADKAVAAAESQRQTQAAVKSYRTALFSNYEWGEGSGWFANSAVESVQDDGRFTYIRLKNDSRGIMSVTAEVDGQPEILEKTYDAAKREYKIAGVYPKFKLRAGESELVVTRKGS